MENNFIVAISGKRGTGKSTLANLLVRRGFTRASFANPLKQRIMKDFDMDYEQIHGSLKEETDHRYEKTPRRIMIDYGNFFRSIDPDFWVKQMKVSLEYIDRAVVIDDMRFPNEADMLKKKGAYLVRLERFDDDNIYKTAINDASETSLDSYKHFNLTIPASDNRTLLDLERVAERILNVRFQKNLADAIDASNLTSRNTGSADPDEFDFWDSASR